MQTDHEMEEPRHRKAAVKTEITPLSSSSHHPSTSYYAALYPPHFCGNIMHAYPSPTKPSNDGFSLNFHKHLAHEPANGRNPQIHNFTGGGTQTDP
jgi:hypothetical protein